MVEKKAPRVQIIFVNINQLMMDRLEKVAESWLIFS